MNTFLSTVATGVLKSVQEPPHIQRAHELAQLIFSEHPPHEQNEMVNALVARMATLREQELDTLKDRLSFMQKDFESLREFTTKLPKIQQ